MKFGSMGEIRSLGLALLVISASVQPAYPGTQQTKTSHPNHHQSYSTSAAQLLVQGSESSLAKVTAVKINTTDKGIEVILESANSEALQVVNNSQGNSYIADIPNAVLALPEGKPFNFTNPAPGIASVSVTQANANTIRITVTGEGGLPNTELFDSDEGLVFAVTPVASTTQQQQQPSETTPEEPKADSDEPIELVVTGEQDTYLVEESSTATKVEVPIRDIPASVQVIPEEVIEDRQVIRLNELADNVSGVRPQETYGGLSSQGYFIRGFPTEFQTLRNGFRDFGFVSPRDVANIERVEFLKGPASILYGSIISPGGVVNTINKQPLPKPFYQINGTIGNYDFYRTSVDLTGPILENRSVLYRLNAAYENTGSFRDFVEKESTFIAPTITVKAGENTNLTFGYEYQKFDYTFDRGFPNNNKVVFDLPISRFLGEPDLNQAEYTSNNFTYVLESRFGYKNSWKFRQGLNILSVKGNAGAVQPDAINEDGRTVARRYRFSEDRQQNISFLNELSGKFNTGSIRHNILLGLELSNYRLQYDFLGGPIADLDIFNPVYGARPESVERLFFEKYGGDSIAFYFQDLVEITPNLKLLAGGRFDWVDSFYRDLVSGINYNETSDYKFSPRVGIVYQPTNSTSIYASWTNSFNPLIFSRNRNNEPFKPETAEQFEVGIKQEFFNNRLSATLAYFDITKKNALTVDPVDPNFSVQTGEQKSRGIELDIVGEIVPGWKIIGTYAYTDAFISEDNDPTLVDNRLVGVPYNSASIWTTYEFKKGSLQGLGLGLGLVYVGDRESNVPNNNVKIPSYLRTDASIFYRRENWRAALNFKNLFDTKYYESQGFFIVPAAPFTVLGTISFEF